MPGLRPRRARCLEMTARLTRRGFLALLTCAAGAALLLPTGSCAYTAAPSATPAGTPPPRAWDNSEILRTGRWAG